VTTSVTFESKTPPARKRVALTTWDTFQVAELQEQGKHEKGEHCQGEHCQGSQCHGYQCQGEHCQGVQRDAADRFWRWRDEGAAWRGA